MFISQKSLCGGKCRECQEVKGYNTIFINNGVQCSKYGFLGKTVDMIAYQAEHGKLTDFTLNSNQFQQLVKQIQSRKDCA